MSAPTDPQETSAPVPVTGKPYWPKIQYRLLLWFGLLLLSMVASLPIPSDLPAMLTQPGILPAAGLFPFGLGDLFISEGSNDTLGQIGIAMAYAFYFIHFVLFLAVRSRGFFYILLWIFIAVLILNTAGCHEGWGRLNIF